MKIDNSLTAPLVWPDLIRVLAIFGVVCIHAFVLPAFDQNNLNPETFFTWLLFIVAKTAVPLFIMLSGALLLGKKESDKVFLQKRVKRILLPWLFWSVIFLVIKHLPEVTLLWSGVRTFTKVMSSEFTFLPVLFCLYLLMPFFRIWAQQLTKEKRWSLIFLWFLGVSLLPFLRNSLAFPAVVDNGLLSQTVRYCGYLFLGYEIKELFAVIKVTTKQLFAAALLFFTANVLTLLLLHKASTEPLLFLSYVAPAIVLAATAAFFLLFHFGSTLEAKWSTTTWQRKVLAELSAASFGVFFCHSLIITFLKTSTHIPATGMELLYSLLFSSLALLFSFTLVIGLRKIPKLKTVVS